MAWEKAVSIADLNQKNRVLYKSGPKQIVLFKLGSDIHAIDNRCPHQGYPLYEGTIDAEKSVTCHWHHWKFDLATGNCLTGGDPVKHYQTKAEEGFIWIDISIPSKEELEASIVSGLKNSFEKSKYGRTSRELARLHFNGLDPTISVKKGIEWSYEKLKEGMGHAYAATAEWLRLYFEHPGSIESQLICLMEAMDHLSKDVYGQKNYPYTQKSIFFVYEKFLDAIEKENEEKAVSMIRGALEQGLHFRDLERALTEAALMHYNGFGHCLIYITKAQTLIELLGEQVERYVLLSLVRSLCRATREDLLPEFKDYAKFLKMYSMESFQHDRPSDSSEEVNLLGSSVNQSLQWVVEEAKNMSALSIYEILLFSNAKNLLYFDQKYEFAYDMPVADNVGWFDFTHAITFANAVRKQCEKFPEFWKYGLLQLACFNGRNSPYVNEAQETSAWKVKDETLFLHACIEKLLDHGHKDNVIAAHFLKTFFAVREEVSRGQPPLKITLLSGLNRLFHSPQKEKHIRRAARQNLALIGRDFE